MAVVKEALARAEGCAVCGDQHADVDKYRWRPRYKGYSDFAVGKASRMRGMTLAKVKFEVHNNHLICTDCWRGFLYIRKSRRAW